jgi:hypothetical protein
MESIDSTCKKKYCKFSGIFLPENQETKKYFRVSRGVVLQALDEKLDGSNFAKKCFLESSIQNLYQNLEILNFLKVNSEILGKR